MQANAAQFFPQEVRILEAIKRIATAYGFAGKNPWIELTAMFDSITLEDSNKDGQFWLTLGNINYRISTLLPGICNGCTADLDFEGFAKLAAQEEDIITLKWKGEKNQVLAGYLPSQTLAIIAGIPYPEKERKTAKINITPILRFALPTEEKEVILGFQENEIEIQRSSEDGFCLSRVDLIGSLIEDDYYLKAILPPMQILGDGATIIAPSNEGIYFSQANTRIYVAAQEIDPPAEVIPTIDPTKVIEVTQINFQSEEPDNQKYKIEQEADRLKILANETIILDAPGLQAKETVDIAAKDIIKLLHCSTEESIIKLVQYEQNQILIAVEEQEATGIHLLLLQAK